MGFYINKGLETVVAEKNFLSKKVTPELLL
jgi:hypothetical protein